MGGGTGITPLRYHLLSPVRVNNEPHLIMIMKQLGRARAQANKIGLMTRCYEETGGLRQYWTLSTLTPVWGGGGGKRRVKEGKGGGLGTKGEREET